MNTYPILYIESFVAIKYKAFGVGRKCALYL